MARRQRRSLPTEPIDLKIESLSHEGRGIAHHNGETIFVDGALPDEEVRCKLVRRQRHFSEATVLEVLVSSPERIEPKCAYFGVCGGCSLQHMSAESQIIAKQHSLADIFARLGNVSPTEWLVPLTGPVWGYRHKARLGVRYVAKKGRTLVGFRERANSFLADLTRCEVLLPAVGAHLLDISAVIGTLKIRDQIPQIEVATGDTGCILVFRIMAPLDDEDSQKLIQFGHKYQFHIYVQDGGIDTIRPLPGQALELSFNIPAYDVRFIFQPSDFTQVNPDMNRLMIDRALGLLDVQKDESVLDLFCGLGNFTLPLARQAQVVTGVEGSNELISRAQENAERNKLANVNFHVADLYADYSTQPWINSHYDKILLDPPRSGAQQIMDWVARVEAKRIVYVSCMPSTLARDADILVNQHGYRLEKAGVMDMFPHTAHVESIALFTR